ncbi:unnamed protein product [Heligmosomoides polygyrus]|uniref:MADF domain-containing protein n=1 Tax=Heligmosomoides polygyrus TaxID=6339 RepID=A0A183F678_HELPZ|nr:unnamed protein product [Heligmosomoides polygyrus]
MDEKYCVYDNLVRRKHWVDFDELPQPQPKRPDHDKKLAVKEWSKVSLEKGFKPSGASVAGQSSAVSQRCMQ